jgi:xyloglucan fucosyltransferase
VDEVTKAVLITSLKSWYYEYEKLKSMYWEYVAATGEVVSVHQPSHEEYIRSGSTASTTCPARGP